MTESPVTEKTVVTIIGTHTDHGYLGYVQEGNIEMDAVVNVNDPELSLLVPTEFIETGNSLVWLTGFDMEQPHMYIEAYDAEAGVSEPS